MVDTGNGTIAGASPEPIDGVNGGADTLGVSGVFGGITGGAITGADGAFTYSFGSTIPGDREVEAKVNGISFKKKALVYFKAPPPDVTVTTTYLDDVITGAKANNTATNGLKCWTQQKTSLTKKAVYTKPLSQLL